MPANVVRDGLRQPGMWITRDADTMRLERRRSGGWNEADIADHQTTMRAAFAKTAPGYFVEVPGMFHANFMDLPLWSPFLGLIGITGPVDRTRAHGILNAYSVAFFDRHLKDRAAPILDGPSAQYEEVVFDSRPRRLEVLTPRVARPVTRREAGP